MDKLKNSIQEANQAVDKEREKNVSLLHLIFPPDIAERLWLGALFFLVVLPLTSLPPPAPNELICCDLIKFILTQERASMQKLTTT